MGPFEKTKQKQTKTKQITISRKKSQKLNLGKKAKRQNVDTYLFIYSSIIMGFNLRKGLVFSE